MKKYVSLCLTLCMLLTLMAPFAVLSVGADGATTGSGATVEDTSWYDASKDLLEISDAADLLGFSYLLGEGTDFDGKTIEIKNDIDLNPSWTAGATEPTNVWKSKAGKVFKGVIDGKGHKISGIYVSGMGSEKVSIFGCLEGGTVEKPVGIQNLAITNSYVFCDQTQIGGLFATVQQATSGTNALIENVYSEITVVSEIAKADDNLKLGGLIGAVEENANVEIRNTVVAGKIMQSNKALWCRPVGGFIGIMNGMVTIEDSLFCGKVSSGGNRVGGFVGLVDKKGLMIIDHCMEAGVVDPAAGCKDFNGHGSMLGISWSENNVITNSIYTDVYWYPNGSKTLSANLYGETNSTKLKTNENNIHVTDAEINGPAVADKLTAAGMTNWTVTTIGCPMPRSVLTAFPWTVATQASNKTPEVYYSQDFNGAKSTELGYEWTTNTSDLGKYSVIDDQLVVDNSADGTADAGLLLYTAPEGTYLTDFTLSYDYTLLTVGKSSSYAGVMAYYADAQNYMGCWVRASGTYNLQQRVGSKYTNMGVFKNSGEGTLGNIGLKSGLNKTYHIELTVKDGQVGLTINGVTAMEPNADISLAQTGKIGIYIKGGVKAAFDNIKLEEKVEETISTVTEFAGYQVSDAASGKMDLRLVGKLNFPDGMSTAHFKKVGFRVVANYDGVTKSIDYSTANVYTGVAGYTKGGNAVAAYTAESLGSDYVFVLPCQNVPADKTITMEVTTYYEDASGIVYGATAVFVVNASSTTLGQ